jgi:hypothetical protein
VGNPQRQSHPVLSDVYQSDPEVLAFTEIEVLEAAISYVWLRKVNHDVAAETAPADFMASRASERRRTT